MSGVADRAKDLVDVQQLIKTLSHSRTFSDQIHDYVRAKYQELWDALRSTEKRYVLLWRNKFFTTDAKSLDDMIATLNGAVDELRRMKADGVVLDPDGGTADDYARLVTTDPDVARKYDMHEESEFVEDPPGKTLGIRPTQRQTPHPATRATVGNRETAS